MLSTIPNFDLCKNIQGLGRYVARKMATNGQKQPNPPKMYKSGILHNFSSYTVRKIHPLIVGEIESDIPARDSFL
jgi:hypothetical protein